MSEKPLQASCADFRDGASAPGPVHSAQKDIAVTENEPLSRHTTLKLGGPAAKFALVESRRQLDGLIQNGGQLRIIGGGSNLLVRDDGVQGTVARLSGQEFNYIRQDGSCLKVGAATPLQHLVNTAAEMGLTGLEGLAGIPGTVGGAAACNAGTRDGALGDVIIRASVMELTGASGWIEASEMKFEYRRSSLKGSFVTDLELMLGRGRREEIAEKIAAIMKQRRASQPYGRRSAGCAFKNPPGDSAGRLIDAAGLKGFRIGGVSVSEVHANFFIAEKNAKSSDMLELIETVRERVNERFGTLLELEIEIW